MVDSTIIRAHQCAAGAKGGTQNHAFGRSRGGFSTKIHLRTNALGLPMCVELTGGEVSDYVGFDAVMAAGGPPPCVMIADKGYDSDRVRASLEHAGATAVIPMRKHRKVQEPASSHSCAKFVRNALTAGGVDTTDHAPLAGNTGSYLQRWGFNPVSNDGYAPQKGDVVVFGITTAHPSGHTAGYDGSQWVSDFRQRHMNPYTDSPPATIYRSECQC